MDRSDGINLAPKLMRRASSSPASLCAPAREAAAPVVAPAAAAPVAAAPVVAPTSRLAAAVALRQVHYYYCCRCGAAPVVAIPGVASSPVVARIAWPSVG